MKREYDISAAEYSLANSIAWDPPCVALIAESLSPADIQDQRVRTIYQVALKLNADRDIVTAGCIWAHIEAKGGATNEGREWWHKCRADGYTSAMVTEHARLIRGAARLRRLLGFVSWAGDVLDGADPSEPNAAVQQLSDRIMGMLDEHQDDGRIGLGDAVAEFCDVAIMNANLRRAGQPVRTGYPTGMAAVDQPMHGGLRPGEMYAVGARPKVGKTAFAFGLAAGVAVQSRAHVLYCAWEDQPLWVGGRFAASAVKRKGMALHGGHASLDELDELVALRDQARAKSEVTLNDLVTLIHRPGAGVELVEREVVRYKRSPAQQRHPLALVVVDHIGRIIRQDSRHGQDSELRRVAGALEAVAKRHHVAVLVLSQLNRDSVKHGKPRQPSAADIRGSDALLEFSSALMFVHRPGAADPDYHRPQEAHLIVEANRLGDTGRWPLQWIEQRGVYVDAESDWPEMPVSGGGRWS